MSKYASDVKEFTALIALGKKTLPELKGDREGVSARLQAVASRLSAALAAAEKYEAKFAGDINALAQSLKWLSDADEDIDKLTALLKAAAAAKDDAAMKRDVLDGAEYYLGNGAGIKWRAPLFEQRDAIVKALKQMLISTDNIAKKSSDAYPAMQDKMNKHIKKQETAVKAMDDLLKKLAAVEV